MMLNSIRTKLTVWYISILALVLMAFAGLTYFLVVRVLAQETDENLAEMAMNFKTSLEAERADEPEKMSIEKDIVEAVNESRFRDYGFAVYAEDGRRVASTMAGSNSAAASLLTNASAPSYSAIILAGDVYRLHTISLDFGADKYRLLVLHSLQEQTDFLERLRTIYLAAIPLALVLAGLGGYFLARKSLAPIAQMSRRAATIGATNLHERLPVKNEKDELGNLAQVVNALIVRLENSFEQQQRFMADASHELRTPLAIVRGESEVALSKVNRPNAELRESLGVVHDESKRLTRIVEDLFTLARADAGQFKTNFTEIYLDELLSDCVRAVRVLAEKRKIEVKISIVEEVLLRGDEELLRRLFVNLLDNAIKYNRAGGRVSISGSKKSENYRVIISDTGAGISKDEQTKIFERFYRADKARSRTQETTSSSAGLGLAIAQWIASLHNGKIKLLSSDESGSCFDITFPVNQ